MAQTQGLQHISLRRVQWGNISEGMDTLSMDLEGSSSSGIVEDFLPLKTNLVERAVRARALEKNNENYEGQFGKARRESVHDAGGCYSSRVLQSRKPEAPPQLTGLLVLVSCLLPWSCLVCRAWPTPPVSSRRRSRDATGTHAHGPHNTTPR